jgi:hypothetical protein
VPRLVLRVTRNTAGIERSGEELLFRKTDLDDPCPALAAADPADVRETRLADLPEQEKIGRSRSSGDALDRRHGP